MENASFIVRLSKQEFFTRICYTIRIAEVDLMLVFTLNIYVKDVKPNKSISLKNLTKTII